MTFDTFTGTINSLTQFHADDIRDGSILVAIKLFDIEAHKLGTIGYSQTWNSNVMDHFSDSNTHYQVTWNFTGDDSYKTKIVMSSTYYF